MDDGNQQIILVEGESEMGASGMGITVNIGDSFQIIGTIIAAVISAIALLKSSNSNSSDRISRAQWAFEMYISSLGIYLSSTSEEDYKKYKAHYYIFYAYVDEEIRKKALQIDNLICKNHKDEANEKLMELIDFYHKKYNLNRFKMKSKCTFFGISKK